MIELLDDPRAFARRAGPFIESSVLHTLLGTVLDGVLTRSDGDPDRPPRFALVTDATGTVTGAALRTPPWPLICTGLAETDAAALVARWWPVDPELPGVRAPTATARALADAFAARAGRGTAARLQIEDALHCLNPDQLTGPPRPAAGRLRVPVSSEHELLVAWEQAFAREAGVGASPEQAKTQSRARISDGRTYVWSDVDLPVCLVGHTPMIAGVPRVGPVYTPPEHRGRGYASSAVAALSRRLFDAGASQIVLHTDLANPTSNKIYAEVGYRRIADFDLYALTR